MRSNLDRPPVRWSRQSQFFIAVVTLATFALLLCAAGM